jgi:hypothetical protein
MPKLSNFFHHASGVSKNHREQNVSSSSSWRHCRIRQSEELLHVSRSDNVYRDSFQGLTNAIREHAERRLGFALDSVLRR